VGTLQGIWVKEARGEPMTAVDEAKALAGQGFDGGIREASTRQLTVLAAETWADAEATLGMSVDPALRRANLLVADLDLAGTTGRVLRVGDLRLEITGETKPCHQMDAAVDGLRDALEPDWRGGVHGEVLGDATVRVGDPVSWD